MLSPAVFFSFYRALPPATRVGSIFLCLSFLSKACPAQAGELAAFAQACSSATAAPEDIIRFCTLALRKGGLSVANEAKVHLNRGLAQSMRGELQLALRDYNLALRLDSSLYPAWPSRGDVQLALGNPQAALEDFDHALQLQVNDIGALIGRADALRDLNRIDEAIAAYDSIVRRFPKSRDAWFGQAQVFSRIQKYTDAENSFARALLIAPEDSAVFLARARMRQISNPTKALQDYRTLIENEPDMAVSWYEMGRLLQDQQSSEARSALLRAYQLGWRDEWLHNYMINLEKK